MPIIATPGAADANSYETLEAAEIYFEDRLNDEAWTSKTDEVKEDGLITATRILDLFLEWVGTIATQTQALRWPRHGAVDRDGRSYDGTTIPTLVKQATCELALWFLQKDRFGQSIFTGMGIKSAKVGPIAVDIDISTDLMRNQQIIPDHILTMLQGLGTLSDTGGASDRMVKLVRA